MPMIATTMSSSISVKPRLPPSRMVRNAAIVFFLLVLSVRTRTSTGCGLGGGRSPRAIRPGGSVVDLRRWRERDVAAGPQHHHQGSAYVVHRIFVENGLGDQTADVGDV